MDFLIKFFSQLGQTIKKLALFKLENFKKKQKIGEQNELDKKIIGKLNKQKIPNWKQFKRLPLTLSGQENILLKILAAIILKTYPMFLKMAVNLLKAQSVPPYI